MTTPGKLLDRFFNYQKPKVATTFLPPTRGAWPDKGNTMRLVRSMTPSLSMVSGVSSVVRFELHHIHGPSQRHVVDLAL